MHYSEPNKDWEKKMWNVAKVHCTRKHLFLSIMSQSLSAKRQDGSTREFNSPKCAVMFAFMIKY